jgi:hypothetical protein
LDSGKSDIERKKKASLLQGARSVLAGREEVSKRRGKEEENAERNWKIFVA